MRFQQFTPGESVTNVQVINSEGVDLEYEGLPILGGHQVTPQQWSTFKHYCSNPGDYITIAEDSGVSIQSLELWRKKDWWKILHSQYLRHAQEDFAAKLAEKKDVMAKAVIDIASGLDKNDRTATARVNAAKLFATVGENPILETRNKIEKIHNTFNSAGDQKILMVNIAKNMTAEEIAEYQRTGRLPERPVE